MSVCWDAEVGVRAPCGALSGQDTDFLQIFRMIIGLSDAARIGPPGSGVLQTAAPIKEATMKIQFLGGALLGACLLLAAVLLHDRPDSAQAKSERVPAVLRARTIELIDARGRVRAQLKLEAGGEVVFRLRDANGVIRTKLGAGASGSGLVLLDDQTEPGIHLLSNANQTSVTLKRGDKRLVLRPGG